MAQFVREGILLLIISGIYCSVAAQSPGGISTHLSSWFKANTKVTGNILPNTNNNTPVNEWKSELGNISVTQATGSRQPLFLANFNTAANFNFNPSLQFASSQTRGLINTGSTPDLLGNNGTYFLVVNTNRETSVTSSTCFSYNSVNTGARYQAKADFRIQTGTGSGFGYIADLDPAATGLNVAGIPAITYPRSSAVVLTSRSAGASFRARRNADTTILGSGSIYYPSIGPGLGIGFNSGGGEATSSAMAEIITYDTYLTDADVNKVESYLAVKYGITLGQNNTFTQPVGPTDYTSSGGTVIWSAAVNAGFGKCITGIGRDDASALLQNQSRSVHDSSLVYLYNGNTGGVFPDMNINNTSTTINNGSFLLFGDNGLTTSLTNCVYNGKITGMKRIWKVQKSGNMGVVTLAVDAASVSTLVRNLLVSTDPTFPQGNTMVYQLQTANGKLYIPITLSSNQYFTFATDSLKVLMTVTQPTCNSQGSVAATITGSTGSYNYSWNTTPVQTGATATSLPGGDYQLTVTTAAGCAADYPVTLVPAPEPIVAAIASQTVVCQNTAVTLTASDASGTVTGYTWMPGSLTGSTITVSPGDTTVYSVAGSDGAGCADTAYVTIYAKEIPTSTFVVAPANVCLGTPQTVTYTGNAPVGATYNWYSLAGANVQSGSGSGPYTILFNNAGKYNIQLQVTNNGCTSVVTTLTDTIFAPVAATFTVTPGVNNPVELHLATFAFSNSSQNATTYKWYFGDGDSSLLITPTHKYRYTGNYSVTLYAMNVAGCSDTAVQKYLMVLPDKVLEIPNAFSPNGDGINERWEIAGLVNVTDCVVEIFNRWGQRLYRSRGYFSPWNGTFGGKPVPVASYYYVIKTATKNYTGWVAVIR